MTDAPVLATAEPSTARLARYLAVFGPGLVVMLADTDVGSVITAGQSGVQWGYRLLLLQLLLVPILYVVQELTVRLAIYTGRGHGELIRETFGPVWAWVSVTGLGIATLGALLTEFAGVAGIGELFGIPRMLSLPLAAGGLLAVVLTGSYRRVERVAIAIGLFELAFFVVAWAAHPGLGAMLAGAASIPVTNPDYQYLAAANIGAVIMPWMVFYQQSAIADKRLGPQHLTVARVDTAIGAVVTQLVMCAVLIACAATIGRGTPGASLDSVGAMSQALTPFLGQTAGKLLFGAGVLGAGMVAAIVVSLALAWGLGEVTGYRHSLEYRPFEARWFYGIYALAVIAGAALVGVW
ncbi:MAG: divalent metal cation transporter, partial [Rhodospirillales bacterium]|nr:divalent metal cation transporter [Rhodospirillales bacterium]